MRRGKTVAIRRLAAAVCLGAAALWLWTAEAEKQAHYTPEYEREDLGPLVLKEDLTEEEYRRLFLQTGLNRAGTEELYREGRQEELFYLQERFFMPVEYECRQVNVVCRGERLLAPTDAEVVKACQQRLAGYTGSDDHTQQEIVGAGNVRKRSGGEPQSELAAWNDTGAVSYNFLPAARTGDILVTFSGHVFGWRSGHAGIVVDGEAGLTLEAVSIGSVSRICSIDSWKEYPCFALLRLKGCSEEEAADIAAYAVNNLADIPYDLFCLTEASGKPAETRAASGEGTAEEMTALSGTQCAHLVWAAFARFGYDLDGDGGRIVTPRDLYESELLEVVQLYGISPLRKD